MNPLRGAVAGAIGGAAGSYTMELFQAWWNEREARTGSKPRATKARTGAAKDVDPATVQVAERILATELPETLKPAAGEAVH